MQMGDLMAIANLLAVRIEEKGGIKFDTQFSGPGIWVDDDAIQLKKGIQGEGDTLVFGDWTYMGRLSALGVCIQELVAYGTAYGLQGDPTSPF